MNRTDPLAVRRPRSAHRLRAATLLLAGSVALGACSSAPAGRGDTSTVVFRSSGTEPPFSLEEATIPQLQEGMRTGQYTARSLAKAYLARIAALEPQLNAMLDLNPEALEIADRLDAERRAGKVRGPLHGIPIVIKDNIATADRMTTTAGALALEGSIAPRDAFVVQQLREAGAVILGKTNLSEWANFRSTQSSSGWSGRGGQTRNPYALDRSPCGSSSGTGAAVAANFAAAGVGTETNGSIVCPSSANGLVGIKPTLGLVSRAGIIPIAHSQDIAGPMARTVTDAAILLTSMVGADARDAVTAQSRERVQADYTRFLDPNGLRGARIGVVRKRVTGYSPETDTLFARAIQAMRAAGAEVIDTVDLPYLGEYGGDSYNVLLYEFKEDLNRYLAELGPNAPVRSLAEVIEFNRRNADRSMPFFGQEILEASQAKGPLSDTVYTKALERAKRLAQTGIDSVMRLHRLDALVAPTGSPAWPIDLINGDHFLGASSSPAAVAGYPNVTVPMGQAFGLPVGISFFGTAWSEPTLIRVAYAFEQATRHRRPPRFLPTAELEAR